MNRLDLPSPAKINRFLHIVGRRADGYHLLQTLFQFLDYGDHLRFTLRQDDQILIHPSPLCGIPDEQNLIYQAARLLQQQNPSAKGVEIQVEKCLPLGAGLGGGSSNAATTLFALNWLWGLKLSQPQLMALGIRLGADVPFFLYGYTAWGEGIGEQLTQAPLPEQWLLVAIPACHISTPKMYAHPDLTRNTPSLTIEALNKGEMDPLLSELKNDFEPLARRLYPEVEEAFKWLSNFGQPRLSGSGASIFVCFPSQKEARAVAENLPQYISGFVAKGINKSPLLLAAENLGFKENDWGVAKR